MSSSWSLLFSRMVQIQLPQPFLAGDILSPLIILIASSGLTPTRPCLSYAVDSRTEHSALGRVLIRSETEGDYSLPCPAGHSSFDVTQHAIGFLGCKHILAAHIEHLINWHPQIIILWAVLIPFSDELVFVFEIALSQEQNHVFGFVETPEVHMSPPLKPAIILCI